jgi:hypothetical protein
LNAPRRPTSDGYTAPAALQTSFSRFSPWRRDGNEGSHHPTKNDVKLPEIIVEINDLRELPSAQSNKKTGPPAISNLAACR